MIMEISILGSGYVGQRVGKGLSKLNHKIIFYDVVDKELDNFTEDIEYAIMNSDTSFICVPTPSNADGSIDLRHIKEICRDIGNCLKEKKDYHLIVVKSTVVPFTTEKIVIPIIEKYSDKKVGEDFGVCMNPEFLTEISDTWSKDEEFKRDFANEDRIVIGESDKNAGYKLEKLYSDLDIPIFKVDLEIAEIIKYASNCMLATKISYWNEMYLICKKYNIDSQYVANIVSMDKRIGAYGSVHQLAFGGKCLKKDLKALINFAKDSKLLKAVDEINEEIEKDFGVRE